MLLFLLLLLRFFSMEAAAAAAVPSCTTTAIVFLIFTRVYCPVIRLDLVLLSCHWWALMGTGDTAVSALCYRARKPLFAAISRLKLKSGRVEEWKRGRTLDQACTIVIASLCLVFFFLFCLVRPANWIVIDNAKLSCSVCPCWRKWKHWRGFFNFCWQLFSSLFAFLFTLFFPSNVLFCFARFSRVAADAACHYFLLLLTLTLVSGSAINATFKHTSSFTSPW